MPKILMHGKLKVGKPGKMEPQSKFTPDTGGKSQMMTSPLPPLGAQLEHQIAGTIVVLLSFVVVIQVFVVIPVGSMISVETPVGRVVMVDVTDPLVDAVLVVVGTFGIVPIVIVVLLSALAMLVDDVVLALLSAGSVVELLVVEILDKLNELVLLRLEVLIPVPKGTETVLVDVLTSELVELAEVVDELVLFGPVLPEVSEVDMPEEVDELEIKVVDSDVAASPTLLLRLVDVDTIPDPYPVPARVVVLLMG